MIELVVLDMVHWTAQDSRGIDWAVTRVAGDTVFLERYDQSFESMVLAIAQMPAPERDWGEETA